MSESLAVAGASALGSTALTLATALALTLLIEVPVAWLRGLKGRRALGAVVINYVLLVVGRLASNRVYWVAVAVLEVLVVLAEWRLLLWVLGGSPRRLLVTSALMNAASFTVGLGVLVLQYKGLIALPVLL